MEIRSIVIDDEPMARKLLIQMIEEFCPEVKVMSSCENLPDGIKAIKKHAPHLVFLDIEMPGYNGLEILDFFNEEEVNFSIIFTTAYSQFALKAFKLSAIDYILKPIDPIELQDAVKRYGKVKLNQNYLLLKEMVESKVLKKIAIQHNNVMKFLELDDILYLNADGSYTHFFLKNGTTVMSSKNLKTYEDMLAMNNNFIRAHKSYILNIDFVTDIDKNDGLYAIMNRNQKIPISSDKLTALTKLII